MVRNFLSNPLTALAITLVLTGLGALGLLSNPTIGIGCFILAGLLALLTFGEWLWSRRKVTTPDRTSASGSVAVIHSERWLTRYGRRLRFLFARLRGRGDEALRGEAQRIVRARIAREQRPAVRNDTHSEVPREWRDTSDHGEMIGSTWVIQIVGDEWIETSDGLVLATHVSLANITDADLVTPRFTIESGARDADLARDEDCRRAENGHPPLPSTIPATWTRDGWLIGAFKYRYVGGRPGYRLISNDIPGNWRGHERRVVEGRSGSPPKVDQARAIETEIANVLWWTGQLLDEAEVNALENRVTGQYQHWAQEVGVPRLAKCLLGQREG